MLLFQMSSFTAVSFPCHATLQSLVMQIAELQQEKAALQKQNTRLEKLESLERALQAERDARTRQLSNAPKTDRFG